MTVYFDMDNVLAAFQKGVKDMCGMEIHDQEHQTKEEELAMWAAARGISHFYDRLEMMPGAKEMFDYAYTRLGPEGCRILSAAPKAKHGIITAAEDKIAWSKRLLAPDVVVHIVYSKHEKKPFCQGKDCILVDDLASNIAEWNEAGGKGILFTDAGRALEELQKIFRDAGIE
ncbi:MAG: hypothetical protein LUE27_08350 [Clostridia bacterium]|nr:hypothetical protein [Clostridia bacterium]